MPKQKDITVTLTLEQVECISQSVKQHIKDERAMIDYLSRSNPHLSMKSCLFKPFQSRISTAEAIIDLLKKPKPVVKQSLTTHPDDAYIIPATQVRATWDYNEQLLLLDPTHRGALMLRSFLIQTFGDISIPPKSGELKPTPNQPTNPF